MRCRGAPSRTRPTFLPGAWGGQWLRRELGIETDEPNLAWSYELIAPESGIVVGADEPLEIDFELLLAEQADRVLGETVAARFGATFPIRFDYLDTIEGGHLSASVPSARVVRQGHVRPRLHAGRDLLRNEPQQGASVFLGLQEGADLEAFRHDAERAEDPASRSRRTGTSAAIRRSSIASI